MLTNGLSGCDSRRSDVTDDETDSRADGTASAMDGSDAVDFGASDSDATDSDSADSDAANPDPADRIGALEATVEALAEQVSQLERNLAWIARQQARETGNGVCPKCDTGGALRVERTPTGKKRVRCSRCDEQFD